MTGETIPLAAYRLGADTRDANRNLTSTQQILNGLNRTSFKDLDLSLSGISKAFGALIPAVSIGSLASFVRSSISASLELQSMADRSGIAASSFSKLADAAKQSDVSIGSLESGIRFFQNKISEAAAGSDSASKVFKELGLNVKAIRALKPEDQIVALADAFNAIQDPTDRVRLAIELFGKSAGPELAQLLGKGSEGIQKLLDSALALDDRGIKALDRSSKALDRFFGTLRTGTSNFVGRLIGDAFGSGDDILDAERVIEKLQDELDGLADREARAAARGLPSNLSAERERLEEQIRAIQAGIDAVKQAAELQKEAAAASAAASAAVNASIDLQKDLIELANLNSLSLENDLTDRARKNAQAAFDAQAKEDQASAERLEAFRTEQLQAGQAERIRLQEDGLAAARELGEQLLDQERQTNAQRLAADQELATNRAELVEFVTESTINGLALLGERSKTAAKIGFAIQKAAALAEAIIFTKTAVARALKSANPPYNYILAAAVASAGAIQIAGIASTQIGSASSSSSSGAGSVPSAPPPAINNAPQQAIANAGPQDRGAVQVIIQGSVFNTQDTANYIFDTLQERLDRDVILFGSNTAQAQLLAPP